MQDFMFATLLFLVYFCFACYLLHNPKAEATTSNPVPVVASANPTVTPQVQQDDTLTRGHSDAERNVSRKERPLPLSQGSESPTESGDSKEMEADICSEPVRPEPHPLSTEVAATQTTLVADLKPEPVSFQQPELQAQVLAVIDNLGKREARKLMGGLKLQQKRNGVELSTELMVASIRREFKADPERVIEVIRKRLPNRLPAVTDQQLAS